VDNGQDTGDESQFDVGQEEEALLDNGRDFTESVRDYFVFRLLHTSTD
jgi:hypothetical protein